jgi:hypothetical protein
MAQPRKDKSDWDLTEDADRDRIGGGPGASDANSGAGNATGAPDADTGMRAGDVVDRGNVEEDRKRLFPDSESDDLRPGEDVNPDDDDDVEAEPGDIDAKE